MKNQEIKFKSLNHNYSIIIGNNTLHLLPKKIKAICPKAKKIALIVDTKIPSKFKTIIKMITLILTLILTAIIPLKEKAVVMARTPRNYGEWF